MHSDKYKHAWYIGSLIREIAIEISEMWESKQTLLSKTNTRILSVKAQGNSSHSFTKLYKKNCKDLKYH